MVAVNLKEKEDHLEQLSLGKRCDIYPFLGSCYWLLIKGEGDGSQHF